MVNQNQKSEFRSRKSEMESVCHRLVAGLRLAARALRTPATGKLKPRTVLLFLACFSLVTCHSPLLWAQQPQAQSGQPLYPVNAKYVNGVAPGYWPTAGSGLTLDLSAGTAICAAQPAHVTYSGGTLAMAASQTNYVYLDPSQSCAPASNTTGFAVGYIPIAEVTTDTTSITGILDVRNGFTSQPFSTLGVDPWGPNVANAVLRGPGPWADVMAYGAKGDGVTDDAPAFQAALEAAEATSGLVYVPEGQFLLRENPFAGRTGKVTLLISGDTVLMPSVPIAMGGFGESVIGLTSGNGFPLTTPEGAVIQPTADFSGSAVIKIDPAVVGPGNVVSGDFVSNLVFDMSNKTTQQVVEIRSLSNTPGFDNLIFANSDGTRIFIGKSANAGAQISEGLNFRGIESYGLTNTGVGMNPAMIIQDAAQISVRDSKLQNHITDTGTAGNIGVLIQGAVFGVAMDDVYLGGYSTHIKVQSLNGSTPGECRFTHMQHESYNIGYDIGGTSSAPSQFNFISGAIFVTPLGASPVNIKLNDYSEWSTVITDNFRGGSATVVQLTAGALSNMVLTNWVNGNILDQSGGSNLVFGKKDSGRAFIANGAVISGLNSVTFSATPNFDANQGNTQKITLTGNVTSSTLSDATAGETLNFAICQDGSGSHTFVWPSNVKGGMTIGSAASSCSVQSFVFDGTNAYALGPGSTSM
jgi:hypothetical protein